MTAEVSGYNFELAHAHKGSHALTLSKAGRDLGNCLRVEPFTLLLALREDKFGTVVDFRCSG